MLNSIINVTSNIWNHLTVRKQMIYIKIYFKFDKKKILLLNSSTWNHLTERN